jgi:TetR/AcrR family acrAB operon transcriptional repressor
MTGRWQDGGVTTEAPKRTRAEATALTRARIMDAARELLAEKPYSEVTMAEIGSRAGIAFSAITYHFGSKRGLLVALCDEVNETFDAMTSNLGGPLRADPEMLGEVSAWFSTGTRRGVMLVAETLRDPELAEIMRGHFEGLLDATAALMDGEDAELEAQAIVAMGLGALFLKQLLPDRIDHVEAMREGTGLMLSAIAARTQPSEA